MAPPSKKPVLKDIDPKEIGVAASEAVLHHLARFATMMSPGVTINIHGDPRESGLAMTVSDLCEWAQTGKGCGDTDARDTLQSVCEALYPRAIDRGTYQVADFDEDANPDTEIGLVVVAAAARLAILDGEPLSPGRLAALASLSPQQVRHLMREGELESKDGEIPAKVAKRWLSARGSVQK